MSLLLFDFDGVLADTLADLLLFGQQACEALAVKHVTAQDDLNSLETMSFADYGRRCGVPEARVEEFVRFCLKRYAEKTSPPGIFGGLAEVVQQLAKDNVIAIVTGNSTQNVATFLSAHGLTDCIRAIFGVDAPGTKVEKIERAKHQLAAEGESVFMVGDSVSDIRAAQESSIRSIAVGWGHQNAERLADAKPDFLVNTPMELLDVIQQATTGEGD